jgi:hypothetical protein
VAPIDFAHYEFTACPHSVLDIALGNLGLLG